MNGKLIPVFVLAALMSCSQPPDFKVYPPIIFRIYALK